MDLRLPVDAAFGYSSASQWARLVTEAWAERELYCPACPSASLSAAAPGQPVIDFVCPDCDEHYQLKAKNGRFSRSVSNSAYAKKIQALRQGTIPNYLFLQYNRQSAQVLDLFGVPSHFFSPSIIRRRAALGATARRAGWVGSTILLGELPADARVAMIKEGVAAPMPRVRRAWARFSFLQDKSPAMRGWLADVLAVVRDLERAEFRTQDIYAFEDELAAKHPNNRNIRPKIRQQLQLLRDQGVLEFESRGAYRLVE